MSILGWVHATFYNCHQFDAMNYMLDDIVLARMMTALDLGGYALSWWVIWKWQWLWTTSSVYGACTHLFSFYHWGLFQCSYLQGNTTHYLPFTPRWPRSLTFHEGVCQYLIFDETPPSTPGVDSYDQEFLHTVYLYDQGSSEVPVPDNQEYLCIQKNIQVPGHTVCYTTNGSVTFNKYATYNIPDINEPCAYRDSYFYF